MHMMRQRPRNARDWPLCSFSRPPRLEYPRVLERITAPLSRPRARRVRCVCSNINTLDNLPETVEYSPLRRCHAAGRFGWQPNWPERKISP